MFEELSDTNHSTDGTQLAQPQSGVENDSVNMFASVWLKVEVEDNETNSEEDIKPEPRYQQQKPKTKKKYNRPTTTLHCDQCTYTTVYKNCLQLHIMGHKHLKPYSCDLCDYTTKYPTSLQRHVLIQHQYKTERSSPKWPVQKCDECDYETYFKWNLNAHKRKHRSDKQYQCELCSYTTAYRHNYIKHGRVHNKQKVLFRCDKCPFVTRFAGHIHRHLAQIHNEVTEKANMCDLCDFSTITRWRLNVHKQRSRQEKAIKCCHCDFETFYKCESKKHKYVHYNEIYGNRVDSSGINDGNIKNTDINTLDVDQAAETCAGVSNPLGKSTDKIDNLSTVSNIDEDTLNSSNFYDNRYALQSTNSQVNKGVTNKLIDLPTDQTDSLNSTNNPKNQTDSAINLSDPPFYDNNSNSSEDNIPKEPSEKSKSHEKSNNYLLDPKCGIDWNSIQVLESDNKERPFRCIKCKYISKFKASVQRHFQRHHTSQNRPYKCCNCDFSTKTKDQIALHNKRSQSDVRLSCTVCEFTTSFKCQFVMHQKCHYAHRCKICDYSCKHKYEIDKHFSTMHMGNGLKCRFCDFKSARKESVLCHETIHTGNKPFKCKHCDYSSVRKTLLDNHLKRYHSDIKKDFQVVSETKIQSLKVSVDSLQDGIENPYGLSLGQ